MNSKILLIGVLVFAAIVVEGFIEENPDENDVKAYVDEESAELAESNIDEPSIGRDEDENLVMLYLMTVEIL